MAVFTGVNVGGESSREVADALVELNRTLEYQMANIDNENITADFVYAGRVKADQIDVGTLTGFTIRTSANFANKVEMNQYGLFAYDNVGIKRISMEGPQTGFNLFDLNFFGENSSLKGNIAASNVSFAVAAWNGASLALHGAAGIAFSYSTPHIDFANIPVFNFAGTTTAVFG